MLLQKINIHILNCRKIACAATCPLRDKDKLCAVCSGSCTDCHNGIMATMRAPEGQYIVLCGDCLQILGIAINATLDTESRVPVITKTDLDDTIKRQQTHIRKFAAHKAREIYEQEIDRELREIARRYRYRAPITSAHDILIDEGDTMYVYFIGDRSGEIKIGRSKNPTQRMKSVTPNGCILATMIDKTGTLESELQERFSEYRVGGEWFEPGEKLVQYINDHRGRPDLEQEATHETGD